MASSYEQIDVVKAKEFMDNLEVTVVDVRDNESFQSEHIPKAILVTDSNTNEFLQKVDKDNPLICYCYHGFSSQMACQYFGENGFKKVYSIIGGLEEWKNNYPDILEAVP